MADEVPFETLFSEPLRNGVSYPSKQRGFGFPMINMREIFAYDKIGDQECELVPLTNTESAQFILEDGDLLFARQSLTYEGAGKCSLVLPSVARRTWDSHIMRARLDHEKAVPAYYYYYFRSPEGRRNIETIVQQVAAAGIRGSDLRRLLVPVPSTAEQSAIAQVLSALDDKIAANHTLCRLVDQLLMAKFGRLAAERDQAMFGEIGAVNSTSVKPRPGGVLRYIDIASVAQGEYEFPSESSWDDAPGRARRGVKRGDTVWSTVRPNRRSHALVLDDDPLLVASTGLAVLTPREGRTAGLYEATRTDQFVGYLESVAEGSAYPAVRADKFGTAPIPALSAEEWDHFEEIALPHRQRAHAASVENRALAALRDALLPLLMLGKVRVREAEKFVKGVV
ncbi:restriction endonuclease subunit S [Kribbella sp. NPDC059898]|uniref:restriction endonuclease subunit S n=1 Tax=Kribbella sp. NPDC059898 TaxID=3346995 RepID=UPI00364F3081